MLWTDFDDITSACSTQRVHVCADFNDNSSRSFYLTSDQNFGRAFSFNMGDSLEPEISKIVKLMEFLYFLLSKF
jgi:hypothetical protein